MNALKNIFGNFLLYQITPHEKQTHFYQILTKYCKTKHNRILYKQVKLISGEQLLQKLVNILMEMFTKDTDLQSYDVNSYCCSGRTTILCWKQRNQNWQTFVRNCVLEIRSLTSPNVWCHSPGTLNTEFQELSITSKRCYSMKRLLK